MTKPQINLLDVDIFAQAFPHDWFTWLRHNEPVYRHPEPDGPGFWVISKHEDITQISRNPEVFRSDDAYGGPTGLTQQARDRMLLAAKGAKSLPHMDAPEHSQYRKLVEGDFRFGAIRALEPRLREVAAQVIDDALAQRQCDLVEALAARLPVVTIAELVGLPQQDWRQMFEYAQANLGVDDPEYIRTPEQYRDAREGLQGYARTLAADRRSCPQQDIMTTLANARIGDEPISEQHVALFFELFVGAGNQTTRTALAQGMRALIDHPDQYQELVDDPALVTVATEEILRWASPVTYFRRAVLQDVTVGGREIKAGDSVSIWYVSGNRDEDVFDQPFAFDIHRTPNNHMAFGAGGPHFCLGSRLAKLEIRVFFEELVQRVAKLRPLGEPVPLRSNHFNAIKHYPVELTPA